MDSIFKQMENRFAYIKTASCQEATSSHGALSWVYLAYLSASALRLIMER